MRCFKLKTADAVRMRAKRMLQDGIIEMTGEYVENGFTKYHYKKKGLMVF